MTSIDQCRKPSPDNTAGLLVVTSSCNTRLLSEGSPSLLFDHHKNDYIMNKIIHVLSSLFLYIFVHFCLSDDGSVVVFLLSQKCALSMRKGAFQMFDFFG